jgi:hypothetical protein
MYIAIGIENDLSKGIPPDVRKRYEIIYDANKDDDDYIDGKKIFYIIIITSNFAKYH